ncbi:hypothetical protein [Nostoc sp.]
MEGGLGLGAFGVSNNTFQPSPKATLKVKPIFVQSLGEQCFQDDSKHQFT